jgi:pyruvate-formate lyase-activating enzyme
MSRRGWMGVDLDGTLAHYGDWVGPDHIGDPIAPMVDRIKVWLGQGLEVRIVTARAFNASADEISAIQDWTEAHIGHRLPVTCMKDYGMIQLWDDRAVRVVENTGQPCCGNFDGETK